VRILLSGCLIQERECEKSRGSERWELGNVECEEVEDSEETIAPLFGLVLLVECVDDEHMDDTETDRDLYFEQDHEG
jgi:hypothetical protein